MQMSHDCVFYLCLREQAVYCVALLFRMANPCWKPDVRTAQCEPAYSFINSQPLTDNSEEFEVGLSSQCLFIARETVTLSLSV